jgi:hypothetical protein
MRVEVGCFKVKSDCNGNPYYLHRLSAGPRPEGDIPPPQGPVARRGDPDTLHGVYSALLECLTLSKGHREALRRRGLADEAIDRAGYRTLSVQGRSRIVRGLRERFGDKLSRVPGFVVKEGQSGRYLTLRGPAGLIVPCRDFAGRIVALKVRRDEAAEGRSRYVYVSSTGHGGPGPGSPVHCPLGFPQAAEMVRLTEGELKADVIQARTGLPTLSVPGVGNWRGALAALKQMGARTVRLAVDADAPEKPTVARPLADCADALAEAGLAVELERWGKIDGKGLDDLLATGKTPELLQGDAALQAVHEILATATADEEPAPPDELARLQDVLDAGGAEALFRDKQLMQALSNLRTGDPAGFAAVRASIRERVRVRDLDSALRSFPPAVAPAAESDTPTYFVQDGTIHRNAMTKDGPVPVALCNFDARIIEDLEHDDGAEKTRRLAVEGTLADGAPLSRAEVPAEGFSRMDWVVTAWGTRAVVFAGLGTKDHLRAALQLLSGDVQRRTIFCHLGWRKVGESWFFLHAAGAIGPDGFTDGIPVSLPDALAGFALPPPLAVTCPGNACGPLGEAAAKEAAELRDAIRASLGLLRLGPDRVTFPLLAAVYRAVLGDTDFGIHLAGTTGNYKSEAAALAQQHFGPGMDARHLPMSWSSTGNALEGLAFVTKDCLVVADDFCPTGSTADVQRTHKDADRLFRGQGNRSGRQRMRADGSLRPHKPPRGLILSTGEDTPRGQSLRARLLVIEISPGDLGPQPPDPNPTLTACQKDAAEGLNAKALAGFVNWLAPRYEDVRNRLRADVAKLRDQARGTGQHARTPGIVADLALGLHYLLDYAEAAGAISGAERADLWRRGWAALSEAAGAQATHLDAAEPAGLFMRLLSAALAGGYAHVADEHGNEPRDPQRWGWRPEEYNTGDGTGTRYKQQGVCVGWLAGGELYLEPEASFAAVQRFARDQNDSFAIAAHTLRRRLNEKGLLATTDKARGKLTVRKTLQGERRDVLHVVWPSAPSAPEPDPADEAGPESWSDSWAGNGQANGEAAHKAGVADTAGQSSASSGLEAGRLGRSDRGRDVPAGENTSRQQANGWGGWE